MAFVNIGQRLLLQSLIADKIPIGIYPHWNTISVVNKDQEELQRTLNQLENVFERAVQLEPRGVASRWSVGRVALLRGNAPVAAQALSPLEFASRHNPLLYMDLLTAYSHSGQHERVVSLHEREIQPATQPIIRDLVAIAYLESAQQQIDRSAKQTTLLKKAAQFPSGRLYASFLLHQNDVTSTSSRDDLRSTLQEFPLDSLSPTDTRLLRYMVDVIPRLLQQKIWSHEVTASVISLLVWKYHDVDSVEAVVKRLIQIDPADQNWSLYLAELHYRNGDLLLAESEYQTLYESYPDQEVSSLRLGRLAESQCAMRQETATHCLTNAASWYSRYVQTRPDDLLGLKRLLSVCARLEEAHIDDPNCQTAAENIEIETAPEQDRSSTTVTSALGSNYTERLKDTLNRRTENKLIVAGLLDLPVEAIEMRPIHVPNATFEAWEENRRPEYWWWANTTDGPKWDPALFASGPDNLDSYEGQAAARVQGLRLQDLPDRDPARAGYQYQDLLLQPNRLYLLTFYYQTGNLSEGQASIWLAPRDGVLFARDFMLPYTGGAWRKVVILGWSDTRRIRTIAPLLRNWGLGKVNFDSLTAHEIRTSEDHPIQRFPTVIDVR